MKYFLKLSLISLILLYSDLSLAVKSVQQYCEIVRNSKGIEIWIEWGVELRENQENLVASNPSARQIDKFYKDLKENLQKNVDAELETAMKADEIINSKYRSNLFPQFTVDQVYMQEWIVYEILLKGEKSVTQNKMAVYYRCMDTIKPLN
jgi:hypothetical protein